MNISFDFLKRDKKKLNITSYLKSSKDSGKIKIKIIVSKSRRKHGEDKAELNQNTIQNTRV